MKTFKEFKDFIKNQGKKSNACQEQYKRVLESETFEELLQVIKDNYNWCYSNNVFTKEELINYVPYQTLLDNGFYYNYSGELLNDKVSVMYYSTIQDVWDDGTIQDVRDNGKYFVIRYGEKPKMYIEKDSFEIIEL